MKLFTPKNNTNENGVDAEKSSTTRVISRVLLIAFVLSILLLFIVNIIYSNKDTGAPDKSWFDLLKNGLISLGTCFTTVLGYYYGQRGYEKVEQKLIQKEEDLSMKEKIIQAAYQGSESVMEEIKEITKSIKKSDSEKPDLNNLRRK